MNKKYVYGPVPSRRMGLSLGVSNIPEGFCNFACVYCQLGRTSAMTNTRKEFFPVEEILAEVRDALEENSSLDVVTIVGEGEPALGSGIDRLIAGMKEMTDLPVALITNGSLLHDPEFRKEIMDADIVLPSLDAFDDESFRKINRPFGTLRFDCYLQGIADFSHEYKGNLWLEVMLVKGINDSDEALAKMKEAVERIDYDRLYINVPVRPPAEDWVEVPDKEQVDKAVDLLGAISIEQLAEPDFGSGEEDDMEAVLSIIRRHPMNQHEIGSLLKARGTVETSGFFADLEKNENVEYIDYKGYRTYRIKRQGQK